jgi:ribose transport system substrate-binding protein
MGNHLRRWTGLRSIRSVVQRTIGAVAAAALLLGLTACSSSRHDPTEKYFLVSVNVKNTYWQAAGAGLVQAARGLGVAAELVGPDTYDPHGEAQVFRDTVAKKPAGILVSVTDPNVMKDPIDAAIAQGIPVITIDSDAAASKRLAFIGTNNYQAGLMGGRVLADRLHGKGNVIVYTMPGQPNLDERLEGYKTILDDHPQIKILRVVNVKGDPRIAFDTTGEALKEKPGPDAFICLVSFACPEVADVLDRNKVSGKVVVAMDTHANTLNWIQKGLIDATIAQKPFTMAHYGVLMLDTLHHFKLPSLDVKWANDTRSPVPMFIDTGATLIDKNNVAEFLKAHTPPEGT